MLTKLGASITYTLRYTKDSYTLAEAKEELLRPIIQSANFGILPCQSNADYEVRRLCAEANTVRKDIMTAAGAYFADHEYYPESLDALNNNYIPRQETVQKFKENFEYTYTGKTTEPEYKYI